MPRTARTVIPHLPHHIIQRGNRRQDVFFTPEDYRMYLSLLKEQCEKSGNEILSYCLMSNHVHLIVVPQTLEGLRPIGEAHRCYTRYINFKHDWRGYLWQGRFASYPMDEAYLYEALRYVELNPVRAGMCEQPDHYAWSSARQRIGKGLGDLHVKPSAFEIEDWRAYWSEGLEKDKMREIFEANETAMKPLINAFSAVGTQ